MRAHENDRFKRGPVLSGFKRSSAPRERRGERIRIDLSVPNPMRKPSPPTLFGEAAEGEFEASMAPLERHFTGGVQVALTSYRAGRAAPRLCPVLSRYPCGAYSRGRRRGGRPISFASVEVAVGRWGSACVCVDMRSRGVAGEALAAG